MQTRSYELLAPAKDLACGVAALECGADAVYIGAERFGARQAAGNPRRDVAALIARAHLFRAKVYAAVNTILSDDELEPARRLIAELWNDGADGVIIQDLGLLELDLPPVPLIASTQMHNDSPARVRFLQEAGFSRAILARELSAEEIKPIAGAAPDVELEAFVHGALCVSYSGRCYLSYAAGGRSANRGECAQPCRKPYRVTDASGAALAENCHALCLKDLNLSAHLEGLIWAGVTSFKIEGRLKDESYVKNTVLWYRRALDAALAKTGGKRASSGTVTAEAAPDLSKTFNRGFTTYFHKNRDGAMHAHAAPSFFGQPAGVARCVSGKRVDLSSRVDLNPGDGLAFFDAAGALRGTPVNKVEGSSIWVEDPQGIAPGTRLLRNHDRLWLKALEGARIERRIKISLELAETEEGLELRIEDEDGVKARASQRCGKPQPKDADGARQTMKRQLAKLGGTGFEPAKITLPAKPLFVPVSVLNDLRRSAVAGLSAARLKSHPRGTRKPAQPGTVYPEGELGFEANVLNRLAEKFLRGHGVKSVKRALETGKVLKGTRVMVCRYCLRHALRSCGGGKPVEPLFLEDGTGARLRLQFDCENCLMEVYV
ncbi:MAG: U32 family peptidase [Elusimicrobia bacterium]|nr:U32 family peptidase [Elusimicrobiota bacterium]